jgi:hypothetical protein
MLRAYRLYNWLFYVLMVFSCQASLLHSQGTSDTTLARIRRDSIGIATRAKADSTAIATRAATVEQNDATAKEALRVATTQQDKVRALEVTVASLTQRLALQRDRDIADLKSSYQGGYQQYRGMHTRLETLGSALTSLSADQSIGALTDLQKYPGFAGAIVFLKQKANVTGKEASWLDGLVKAATPIIGAAMGATAVQAALSLAGQAVSKLQAILPAWARQKMGGDDMINTVESFDCGLRAVSGIQANLALAATSVSDLTKRVDSLRDSFGTSIARYPQAVGLAAGLADPAFYVSTEAAFKALSEKGQDVIMTTSSGVKQKLDVLQTDGRAYNGVVTQHIAYWQQLRDQIAVTRGLSCIAADPGLSRNYDGAVTAIDSAIGRVRKAYLF